MRIHKTSEIFLYLAIGLLEGCPCRTAWAQTPKSYFDPTPVIMTGGHQGFIKGLVFSRDGSRLYSASLDKTFWTWDLGPDRLQPGLIIRPPVGRGVRGMIRAMAIAPRTAGRRGDLIALAGNGVTATFGEVLLVELGEGGKASILGQLPRGEDPNASGQTHSQPIECLAASPDGHFLASGSRDGTVHLWDLATRSLSAVLPVGDSVVAIAYHPTGDQLVLGTQGGKLQFWQLDGTPRLLPRTIGPPGSSSAIVGLAFDKGGNHVFVHKDNGDAAWIKFPEMNQMIRLPGNEARRELISFALSHGERCMVTCLASERRSQTEPVQSKCEVQLRSTPDGQVIRRLLTTSNRASACAFSPDDRFVAVAGGDDQAIYLIDLTQPDNKPVGVHGTGSSIREVAFDASNQAVGFSREPADDAGRVRYREGFDLKGRRFAPPDAAAICPAIRSDQGWRLAPSGNFTIDLIDPANRVARRLALDPSTDGRWWTYSFIPSDVAEKHPRRTVAIGTDNGSIVFFDSETGNRTRVFAGHSGPTYSLAPSPNGRWLVTGSGDQTIKLWKLAGCDTLPRLGAKFELAADGQTARVVVVEPFGFGDGSVLKVGDVVEEFFLGRQRYSPRDFLAQVKVDNLSPNLYVQYRIRGDAELHGTSRRDTPVLTLFPATDGQWVLWMPQGYYDTSAAGDRRHLGWHVNRGTMRKLELSDYLPIDRYEKELRRPQVIERLLATGDIGQAIQALNPGDPTNPAAFVAEFELPKVEVAQAGRVRPPGPGEDEAEVPLRLAVAPRKGGGIRSINVRVNGRTIPSAREAFEPPQDRRVDRSPAVGGLRAGPNRVYVTVTDDQGRENSAFVDVAVGGEARARAGRAPRQVVLAIGVDAFADAALDLPQAKADAKEIADVFGRAGSGERSFAPNDRHRILLNAPEATGEAIAEQFDRLARLREAGDLTRGDTLIVALESHLLEFGSSGGLLGADGRQIADARTAVPAEAIAAVLGGVAQETGCRVILLLDVLHPATPAGADRVKDDWIRSLYRERGVIVFDASVTQLLPQPDLPPPALGVFAQAIRDAPGRRARRQGPFTLDEFRRALAEGVAALDPDQKADGFWPSSLPLDLPLFEPGMTPSP